MNHYRLFLSANITPDEAHILDTILHAAGFANRTDYLTALLHTTIHGENTRTLTTPPPGSPPSATLPKPTTPFLP